jgi:hypothetical protein
MLQVVIGGPVEYRQAVPIVALTQGIVITARWPRF